MTTLRRGGEHDGAADPRDPRDDGTRRRRGAAVAGGDGFSVEEIARRVGRARRDAGDVVKRAHEDAQERVRTRARHARETAGKVHADARRHARDGARQAAGRARAAARQGRHRAEPRPDAATVAWPVALLALLCVIALVVAVVALSGSDRTNRPSPINGDQLGPAPVETVDQYVTRADAALDAIDDAEPHWALVSLLPARSPSEAAAAVDGIAGLRVATMIVGSTGIRDIPEPVAGATRADVLTREYDAYLRALTLPEAVAAPEVTGLVVRATADRLREIRGRDGVAAVEPLPADAVAGRFGIRPLTAGHDAFAESLPEALVPPAPEEPDAGAGSGSGADPAAGASGTGE